MWDHSHPMSRDYGGSPGNGITPMQLSSEPLASEAEATPGPPDFNPYEELEKEEAMREVERMRADRDPTAGDDPYLFDDVGDDLAFSLPVLSESALDDLFWF